MKLWKCVIVSDRNLCDNVCDHHNSYSVCCQRSRVRSKWHSERCGEWHGEVRKLSCRLCHNEMVTEKSVDHTALKDKKFVESAKSETTISETTITFRFIGQSTHVIKIHKANDGGLSLGCAGIILKKIGRFLLQCSLQVCKIQVFNLFRLNMIDLENGQVMCARRGDNCTSTSARTAENYQWDEFKSNYVL